MNAPVFDLARINATLAFVRTRRVYVWKLSLIWRAKPHTILFAQTMQYAIETGKVSALWPRQIQSKDDELMLCSPGCDFNTETCDNLLLQNVYLSSA